MTTILALMSFGVAGFVGFADTATPMEKRPSKKADRGVVVLRHELKNQRQQTVLTAEVSYLMLRKENN